MKKATFIKGGLMKGNANLYRLSEPIVEMHCDEECSYDYVIVSKVNDFVVHETYIFGANEEGEVVDWIELDGSRKGEWSHEEVLSFAGYEVDSY